MPSSMSSLLLFGEGSSAGDSNLAAVSHLNIHRDVAFVGDFGVALYDKKVVVFFAWGGDG